MGVDLPSGSNSPKALPERLFDPPDWRRPKNGGTRLDFAATTPSFESSEESGAHVPAFARCRILVAFAAMLAAAPILTAADGGAVVRSQPTPSSIVIGFVGGFVRHDNPNHGPVKLAESIQKSVPNDAFVEVFENRHRKTAYSTILRLLDRNHDGVLSSDEKSQARIVLFGHSWGASAVVMLARELQRVGIPVLLTVQVDSVAKLWQQDGIIPANVAAAVNFYQPHGFIRGRAAIAAADPSKTQILGNYRFDYKKDPVTCEGTTWFGRAFMSNHLESECDPHLWSQVADLVRKSMQLHANTLAANPRP